MSLHRVCCCGDGPEGACGFIGEAIVCDGTTQVPANSFIPGRSIAYSGTKKWVRTFGELYGDQTIVLTDVVESGVVGFAYQFGRTPTDDEILADNPGLQSFSVINLTGSPGGGPPNTSDGSNVGFRRFWAYNLESLTGEHAIGVFSAATWNDAGFGFNCQPIDGQTQTVTGDAANYSQRITFEQFDGFGNLLMRNVQTYALSVTLHRDIRELPSYWLGSPTFNVCSIPGGTGTPFRPRPPETTSTTDANASAIEAMQANDPLRTCRGCGG